MLKTKKRRSPAKPLPASLPKPHGRRASTSKVALEPREAGRERWTVRVKSDLIGRVNRAALYALPRVTVSEILEAALEAELAKREKAIPAGAPLVSRGEIPRGRLPRVRQGA